MAIIGNLKLQSTRCQVKVTAACLPVFGQYGIIEMLSVCGNRRELSELGDLVLLIDYVMSLQYFRIFRMDDDPQSALLELNNGAIRQRLGDISLLRAYVDGLKLILDGHPVGPKSKSLWQLASSILVAELKAALPWMRKEHHEMWPASNWTDDIMNPGQMAREAAPDHFDSFLQKLGLLLRKKLVGEQKRHTAGRHTHEDDEIFNETDRIVKRLLSVSVPELQCESCLQCMLTGVMMQTLIWQNLTSRLECDLQAIPLDESDDNLLLPLVSLPAGIWKGGKAAMYHK